MWKKRKEIEGVSMGPLIALKASVFGNNNIFPWYFPKSPTYRIFLERQFTEKQMKASAEKKPKVTELQILLLFQEDLIFCRLRSLLKMGLEKQILVSTNGIKEIWNSLRQSRYISIFYF